MRSANFGGGGIASVAGVIGGVALAIGLPWVLLVNGQILGQNILTILIMIAVIGGVFISFVSAVLGVVMPTSVHDQWANQWNDPEKSKKWEEWKLQKKHGKPQNAEQAIEK
jgi:hypothetical protein